MSGGSDKVTLPTELLSEIFCYVRHVCGLRDLLSCVLCCSRWKDIAISVLERHVVLTKKTIGPFVRCETTRLSAIRSISVGLVQSQIFNPLRPAGLCNSGPLGTSLDKHDAPCKYALQHLEQLALLLPWMVNLRRFSLCVTTKGQPEFGFHIDRAVLVALIESLPRSCTEVELDTLGFEYGDVHVCSAIASRLNGLSHVRLRLGSLCSLSRLSEWDGRRHARQSILVNTICLGGHTRQCGSKQALSFRSPAPTATTATAKEGIGHGHSLVVVACHPTGFKRTSVGYTACTSRLLQAEAAGNVETRIPFCTDAALGFVLQLPRSRVVVATWRAATVLAEGGQWVSSAQGDRMPTVTLEGSDEPWQLPELATDALQGQGASTSA